MSNNKFEFSCAVNNFKANYWKGKIFYCVCGNRAYQIKKTSFKNSLTGITKIEGFVLAEATHIIYITNVKQ